MVVNERPPTEDVHAAAIAAFERVALLAANPAASFDDVLRLIGSIICQRLGLNRCFVYLRREDGRFQGRIGYRVNGGDFDRRLRGLITGDERDAYTREIAGSLQPVVLTDAPHDPRVTRRATRRWGVSDMLGVPLVVEREAIGILYIDDDGTPRVYTEDDVRFTQVFAGLSALTVRQCWLYHRLDERARRIDSARQGLAEVARVHDTVTRAVRDGADLDAVLRVVGDLLGKPVVLYSPRMDVMAWSAPAESGWTAPPALTPALVNARWIRDEIAKLATTGSVMLRATRESLCRRLLVRLESDGRCLGYLELCELGRPFAAIDARALEQAGLAVTLKVLAVRREAESQRQEREDFGTDLVYGRRDRRWLAEHAATFGVNLHARHVLLRAEYAAETGIALAHDRRRREELAALVTRRLGAGGRTVAQASGPGADVLLVEVTEGADGVVEERLRALLPALVERLGVQFVIVSDPVADLTSLPARMDKLKEVAILLADAGAEPRLAFARELDLMLLTAPTHRGHGVARHARELLAPLIDHDAATGSALVETLRVFVECRAQVRSTAAALDIHENTVRYRLNRIRDLSSVDPERFDSLLSVSMAFQAHDLARGAAAPVRRGRGRTAVLASAG